MERRGQVQVKIDKKGGAVKSELKSYHSPTGRNNQTKKDQQTTSD